MVVCSRFQSFFFLFISGAAVSRGWLELSYHTLSPVSQDCYQFARPATVYQLATDIQARDRSRKRVVVGSLLRLIDYLSVSVSYEAR